MKWLDMPPAWLVLMIGLADAQARLLPLGPGAPGWAVVPGWGLILGGLALAGAAAVQFRRARTTIVPHRTARFMVTTGVYRLSRNPIYLGDVLVLAGFILCRGAWPSVVLLPLFAIVITRRFILPEEARLRAAFGGAFDTYAERTNRWI